jgi:hypothetical protein
VWHYVTAYKYEVLYFRVGIVKHYLFVASHNGITFYVTQKDDEARGMHGASAFPARVDPSPPDRRFQNVMKEPFYFGSFDGNATKISESVLILLWGNKIYIFWDITPCNPFEIQSTFRRNMSPPHLGSKTNSCYLLHAGFFLDLFIDPEGGGDISSKVFLDFQRSRRR